ncbi:MAG: hypothetical protein ACYCS7_13550 [Acidimicrobiales bacterium]
MTDDIVVSGGHNGLVAAGYLTRGPVAACAAHAGMGPTSSGRAHRTPIAGLCISGAGTTPTGGIAGTPGEQAAKAVLADRP